MLGSTLLLLLELVVVVVVVVLLILLICGRELKSTVVVVKGLSLVISISWSKLKVELKRGCWGESPNINSTLENSNSGGEGEEEEEENGRVGRVSGGDVSELSNNESIMQ